ncbi:MAG: HTH domain-containing protein [Candidatus Aenigmarchaeota archaeon]
MKRDPLDIMMEMMKVLERGRPLSINELAKETGLHNITVRKYIRIIEVVRREPTLEIIKTRHSIIVRVRD